MDKYKLTQKLKFRLENIEDENIIFCYDERINEYFAMDSKYYSALNLLENGICKDELLDKCKDVDVDLLLRGLLYRKLLFVESGS